MLNTTSERVSSDGFTSLRNLTSLDVTASFEEITLGSSSNAFCLGWRELCFV